MHRLVAQMDTLVDDVRPDLVVTHSAHDLHWDHSLVSRDNLALDLELLLRAGAPMADRAPPPVSDGGD